jgi:hypothetical protein
MVTLQSLRGRLHPGIDARRRAVHGDGRELCVADIQRLRPGDWKLVGTCQQKVKPPT